MMTHLADDEVRVQLQELFINFRQLLFKELGSVQGVEELQQLAVLHGSSSVGALDQTHDDLVGHEHHSEDVLVQRHVLLVGPDQVDLRINTLVLHAQDHVVLTPLDAGDIGPLRDGTKIDNTQAILLVLLVDPQHLASDSELLHGAQEGLCEDGHQVALSLVHLVVHGEVSELVLQRLLLLAMVDVHRLVL